MSTKQQIDREAASAKDKLNEASDEIKNQARSAVDEAQRAATNYAEDGKNVAAGSLTDFAKAVRSASDELSSRDQGMAARFVTEAADGLERVANSVSGTSVEEMAGSVTDFARRNPGPFLVGTVLAGVALGRFVKASSERSHDAPSHAGPAGTPYRPTGTAPAASPVRPASSAPAGSTVGTPTRPNVKTTS
ncbi:hypothetical protein RDV64_18640 [Acuticoccus sp. MNP-M23]|uniref:hypothetical protein n=1 Tax=Acuticoccus sp. MNP-M23 TaxID=3072793 RepID=UPI0028166EE6|nr:hypothetical protein [Acuticoccus sp. MNP-M23]WMS42066.1 hypothetical protein RDV64_18640 [Acuticoccus sp. MNP-M23]